MLQWAWNAFQAIITTTRAGSGYSEITNVNAPNGGTFLNFQDSFYFAEVLKYAYLIHAPDSVFQVEHNGVNEYVFNTEAHPFKVSNCRQMRCRDGSTDKPQVAGTPI